MVSTIFADEPIALITKSRGNIKYKISSESKLRSNAIVNTPIFHANIIKTKAKSFSQIVYLDDLSLISVYPKTEISINGKIKKRIISKQVDITEGIVRVKVFNQITSEFKLTTPHSQLTCFECDFWVISNKETGDRFYKISGNIFVINPSMIEPMEMVNDSTIISLNDTKIEMYPTPMKEVQYLELLMLDFDNMSEETDVELTKNISETNQTPKLTTNVVEIRLKNTLNIERKIILTYTK